MYKMGKKGEKVVLYKLCVIEQDDEKVSDIGWAEVKYHEDSGIPIFREETQLILVKSYNNELIENENDYNLLLYGGHNDQQMFNDLWMFDTYNREWFQTDTVEPLVYIKGHSLALQLANDNYMNNRIYMFGGNY